MTTLHCKLCDRDLPDNAFVRNRTRKDRRGRNAYCRECSREYDRQHPRRDYGPRECSHCGKPTSSRRARLCSSCLPEHQSGLYRDRFIDTHGEPYWTKARIVASIKEWNRRHGRPPSWRQWDSMKIPKEERSWARRRKWPSPRQVTQIFGSWNAAIEAAGLTPRERGRPKGRKGNRCPKGHPWVNPYVSPSSGKSWCRTCINDGQRRRRAKRKATT